ncbi:MAG: dicarboxylate/amino acid:cation symporter [Planctomycetes bacterium]|nr:dicarboxylate/amino acid:cation symporter [Planctomycetota bacterium]
MSDSPTPNPPPASTRLALHWKVLIALAIGIALGSILHYGWTAETWKSLGVVDVKPFLAGKESDANAGAGFGAHAAKFAVDACSFVGKLFLLALRFIAIPIILSSMILAVASLGDIRKVGRIGLKTITCFAITLVVAIVIAIGVVQIVKPGKFVTPEAKAKLLGDFSGELATKMQAGAAAQNQTIWSFLLDIIPANPIAALATGNMLQVVAIGFLVGVGLTMIPREKSTPVVAFFDGLSSTMMELVRLIMACAPVAVFCLITQTVTNLGFGSLASVLLYCLCVIGGLAIVLLIEYPILIMLMTPRSAGMTPKKFFAGLSPAITLAFSSSSSTATLPVTMACCRDRLKIPASIVNFVCPMGTTINMDGTALYQVVSVVFLSQLYGMDLSATQLLTVGVMAAVVAIGAPGLPGASVIMMAVVLESVGIPTEGIAIILAVDRLLDMSRTIVNVAGDAVACVVVAGWEGALTPNSERQQPEPIGPG